MATKEQLQSAATEVPEPHVSERDADVTFNILKQYGGELAQALDSAGEKRLDRKLYFILVPLLVLINLLLFVSTSSLSCLLSLLKSEEMATISYQVMTRLTKLRWPTRPFSASSKRLASMAGSTITSTPSSTLVRPSSER